MIRVTPRYEEALARRNPQQRAAIEKIDGPVLVIAGPGTGKTDVLSLRIGNILLKTDTASSGILCLTYTEAGASEMRNRLLQYIGPEANNIRIQTFHGFCNTIIQEHVEFFGGTRELKLVSDLEKMEVLIDIIESQPDDSLLRRQRGDIYYARWQLRELYDLMKGEGWSVDFIEKRISAWLEEVKTHENFIYKTNSRYGKKGSLKEKAYQAEVDKMAVLSAAVQTFREYEEKMNEKERYDYADMLIWVRDAFNANEDLLLDYQERFQYVLVDEFQDTNGIQLELLKQLTDYEQPNVFVVGDDDQAIFRFQGALVRNIADFYHSYQPEIITLQENYRSSAHIIETSAGLIRHNRYSDELAGLVFTKALRASGVNAGYPGEPRVLSFQNRDQETAFLSQELTSLHRDGILEHESVAVIYRRHILADNIVRVLRNHDVPFSIARDVNLLDEPVVNHIIMILEYVIEQYLSMQAGDDKLYTIMHFRHFGVPPRDIARIAHACKPLRSEKGFTTRKALRDLVAHDRKLKSLEITSIQSVRAFSNAIEELCGSIHEDTPPMYLDRLIHQTGLLKWVLRHPERDWYLLLLKSLMSHCIYEKELNPMMTLDDYVTLLARHREHNVPIPVRKAIEARHGIELITAHGAKGHEYDRVYIIGCTKQDWEDYRGRTNDAYRLPGNLVADRKESSTEDDRRLFYVAMTRARRDLTMTYPESDDQRVNIEPSRFVAETVAASTAVNIQAIDPEDIDVYAFYASVLDRKTVFPEMIDKALVDAVLADYRLSATDFNLFLECPRSFYFEKILKVPSAPQLYFTFGNVVHKSLELLFSEYWDTLFLTGDTLLDLYRAEMERNRGKFTDKEFENYMQHGTETLKLYSQQFAATWRDPDKVITEYRVDNIEHRGVPLKGFLDKVEVRPSTVHIVDYKTGKYERKKFYLPGETNPVGGTHWRQMMFYKILLNEDPEQEWNVVKGIMDFVDIKRNKKPRREEILFDDERLDIVSDMIVEVYDRIRSYDYDHKCNRWRCKWCELVESEFPGGELASGIDNHEEEEE